MMKQPISIENAEAYCKVFATDFPSISGEGKDITEAANDFEDAMEEWFSCEPDEFKKWFKNVLPQLREMDKAQVEKPTKTIKAVSEAKPEAKPEIAT